MKKFGIGVLSILAGAFLIASIGSAASAKTRSTSCKQIREALASGKSAGEVASQFNVSTDRVNHCAKTKAAKHKSSASHATAKQQ
jgi:hypothetical protein